MESRIEKVAGSQRRKVTRMQSYKDSGIYGFKKLIVWQKADQLAHQVYSVTKMFPKEEMFGITSQIRRAALSVPTNIVEGVGRQNKGELKYFLNVALGSLAELEYLLLFCKDLTILKIEQYQPLEHLRQNVGGLLWRFYKVL